MFSTTLWKCFELVIQVAQGKQSTNSITGSSPISIWDCRHTMTREITLACLCSLHVNVTSKDKHHVSSFGEKKVWWWHTRNKPEQNLMWNSVMNMWAVDGNSEDHIALAQTLNSNNAINYTWFLHWLQEWIQGVWLCRTCLGCHK